MLDARVRATLEGYGGQLPTEGDTVVVIGVLSASGTGLQVVVANILKDGKPI